MIQQAVVVALQAVLSKYIAKLRTNTTRYTDERVRLAGEAIAGSLAVKMLGQPHHLSTALSLYLNFAPPQKLAFSFIQALPQVGTGQAWGIGGAMLKERWKLEPGLPRLSPLPPRGQILPMSSVCSLQSTASCATRNACIGCSAQ